MDILYKKLNTRIVSQNEFDNLNETIKEQYKISKDISFYNPNLNLFTNYFNTDKTFNNNNKLRKLIKKKERMSVVGYFYKALIRNKNNNSFYKNIFVKEIPLFSPELAEIYYNYDEISIEAINNKLQNTIYNLNSPQNTEIFVNYLTSKLSELNISPNFCEFYGCYNIILEKFTFDISDHDDIQSALKEIVKNIDKTKYKILRNKHGVFLEYKNMPTYLLATERVNYDISFLDEIGVFNIDILKSICFQIFSSIIIMYSVFGIKHNDLHFGNIMLQETNKKYLYYNINGFNYRVPTFGYIVKIIDWGRSTYNFNDFKSENYIFNYDSECFGQFVKKKINNRGIKNIPIYNEKWTDIGMVSYSILHEYPKFHNTDLGKLLIRNITTTNKKKKIDISTFGWKQYTYITNNKFKIEPKNLLLNKLFDIYRQKNRPDKEIIYNIYI